MMGLFKKPNRKFRQRVTHTDSEEEEAQDEQQTETKDKKPKDLKIGVVSPASIDVKDKSIVTSKEGTSKDTDDKSDSQPAIPAVKLLSFDDEEDDGEVFKLKKSNYSRRLAKQLERERKKRQENPTVSSTFVGQKPGKFDPEKKEESKEAKDADEVLCGKEAEDMDVDNEDEESKESQQNNPFKDVLQSGIIPDAATIYAMKKHRQLAREMKDFIPVDPAEKDEESQSRLIREDDNDRSDDDDDEEPSRLSFNVNTNAVERQKVREAFLSLQEGSQEELENEDAAELERWEREQIRKGVSIAQGVPSQSQPLPESQFYSAYLAPNTESKSYYPMSYSKENESLEKPIFRGISENHKSELTTENVKARLQERLASLKELHETHKQEVEAIQKELIQCTELIEKHEKEAPENAGRFQLYQQLRGYVRDLVECLDMKVAHIDVLDTKMLNLYKTRAKNLISRRQLDVRDQADEYSLLSCKILKGNPSDMISDKNGCVDEAKLRRGAEREGRRIRRRKQRERTVLPAKHHDGMSSDDEEADIDIINFKEKRENILQECIEVFEDVVDEFGTLQGVMLNFERWKSEQNESYCNAYVPLCLPKIFSPFVRLEMLGWNPLEEEIDLEETDWYKTLAWYGYAGDDDVIVESDPDMNLLPAIVEKTLIPKITAFVKDVWDPLSSKQTTKLVNLLKRFYEEYPTINGKSKQVQTLLQSVCSRIQLSFDDDVFIPLYPKELLENRSSGSAVFFQRQFWSTVKLLKNIICWEGILAEQPLQDMALSSLLNRYLLMGLNTSIIMKDSVEKCKMIVSVFPKSWFLTEKNNNTSLPQLKQFSQYLVRYAQSLASPVPKKHHQEDEDIRSTVIEVMQLLITIGSLDEAVVLAKQFSISGFRKEK